jgi:cellulose synthase/poly-beta-1,6-N-acetylglucosamine synthase-like glycosyltransferase
METSTIFWILTVIVFYTFFGYGILLWLLVKLKKIFTKKQFYNIKEADLPEVTLLIAAYNEHDFVAEKVKNSLALNYPKDKLKHIWVTDGSNDGTPDLLSQYADIQVLHKPERSGKINAMHRAMEYVKTPIVVFSDANTMIGPDSIQIIAKLFNNSKIGCVSGEKRIRNKKADSAAGAGEGFYWRYESFLKKLDFELYSTCGAAGELFAIRRELYQAVKPDTILDDFVISLQIVMKGYKIAYDPNAYAEEKPSASTFDEFERKTRIAAGGLQSIFRLLPLFNIFKYKIFSFQYVSHRVLRWTITPYAFFALFPINVWLALESNFFFALLFFHILFYFLSWIGLQLENKSTRVKIFFIPYYFVFMNVAVIGGHIKYFKKRQSVNWTKAKRAED